MSPWSHWTFEPQGDGRTCPRLHSQWNGNVALDLRSLACGSACLPHHVHCYTVIMFAVLPPLPHGVAQGLGVHFM